MATIGNSGSNVHMRFFDNGDPSTRSYVMGMSNNAFMVTKHNGDSITRMMIGKTTTALTSGLDVNGTVKATLFSGSGASLTSLPTSSLTGQVAIVNGGTNLSATPTNGQIPIGNGSGYTLATITGTANQITSTAGAGTVTLSLPQSIHTAANVQFNSFGVGTAGSGTAGEIRATGDITAYYSDMRMKTNIEDIPDALAKIEQIRGVYYTQSKLAESFGYTKSDRQVGVIAQEVQAVLPEVIKVAPFDMKEDGTSASGEDYLTVQYDRIVPLLIQAIKEQNKRIKALEGRCL